MFVTTNIHPVREEGVSAADAPPSRSLQLIQKHRYAPEVVKMLNSSPSAGIEGTKEDLDLRKRV